MTHPALILAIALPLSSILTGAAAAEPFKILQMGTPPIDVGVPFDDLDTNGDDRISVPEIVAKIQQEVGPGVPIGQQISSLIKTLPFQKGGISRADYEPFEMRDRLLDVVRSVSSPPEL